MARVKSKFVCQECGYESSGWLGKCPACLQWNTIVEEKLEAITSAGGVTVLKDARPVKINDIEIEEEPRYTTGIKEMDRVLGGGVVKGSLILVGGDPGIGKSTLLLQLCDNIKTDKDILYISGEESTRQIKLRAQRLNVNNERLSLLSETEFETIEKAIDISKPSLVIIDSIQTVFNRQLSSAPGSVSQVREATASLMRIAKTLGIAIMIVGHVTKEGALAGPRVLEHMVDTVLYFEGERHLSYRILRAVKNRFGSTNEIGIFEMKDKGLCEITNPSAMLLAGRIEGKAGSVVVSSLEGSRPVLMEIQALACATSFNMPRRTATGTEYNRLVLLIAVLEKIVGMQLHSYDIYVNVVGGLKTDEPACDLGIVCAMASSYRNVPIDVNTVFIGEVGLTGEIRAVNQIEKRVMEAKRLGFKTCILPKDNMEIFEEMKNISDIVLKPVRTVEDTLNIIL